MYGKRTGGMEGTGGTVSVREVYGKCTGSTHPDEERRQKEALREGIRQRRLSPLQERVARAQLHRPRHSLRGRFPGFSFRVLGQGSAARAGRDPGPSCIAHATACGAGSFPGL